jgi:hypothetical protein
MNPDRSGRKTIVTDCHLPDGMVMDAEGRLIAALAAGCTPDQGQTPKELNVSKSMGLGVLAAESSRLSRHYVA